MDFRIILPPELHIDPAGFASAWNAVPECPGVARTRSSQEPALQFCEPGTAFVFIGGLASGVAVNVISALIVKLIENKWRKKANREKDPPRIEVLLVDRQEGACILVVHQKES